MRVVIVGGGADGSYLTQRLSAEGEDVTLIEVDRERAARLREELDAMVIAGNGASPAVLRRADIQNADLLIAVSDNDGANIVACQAATRLGVPRTVARIEDRELRLVAPSLGLESVIDSRESTGRNLVRLVRHSGVSDLIEFSHGHLMVVGGIIQPGAPIVGQSLAELRHSLRDWDCVVAAVVREGEAIIGRGDTVVKSFDQALLVVPTVDIDRAIDLMGLRHEPIQRVVIVGISRVAAVAAELFVEAGYDVVVVDSNPEWCRSFAERNREVEVVLGDRTDPATFHSLGVAAGDAVLGMTLRDEINILTCLIGDALGASLTIARYHRISLFGLVPRTGIDATVSSRLAAANTVLRFVRRGRILSAATFMYSDLEALEIEVDSDSDAAGSTVAELALPKDAVIGGVFRHGRGMVPVGDTRLEAGDRVLVLALPRAIHGIESLFAS